MLRNETAGDPDRTRAALAGLRAYQNAERAPAPPAATIVGRIGRVSLRSYGTTGRPILFVPSLINGSEILDLTAENSMMRGLAAQGLNPVLLDWGCPTERESDLDIGGHIENYLLPALDIVGRDAAMAGYCLGGTMALAAAILRPPKALILIATPWTYDAFPSQTRSDLQELWLAAEPLARSMGVLPVEILQQIFWRIDPARTVAKFEQFATKNPASAEGRNYVAVEDWANDGPPLSYAAGRELMEDLIGRNMSGTGQWCIAGCTIDPAALSIPLLNFLSTTDRITPAASGWRGGEKVALSEGHVGMIVGRKAPGSLWSRLSSWLSQLREN